MKEQKGITLAALTITIIVLFILIGVGIGTIQGTKGNIKTSRSEVKKSDLVKVQQAVLETYIKYKQVRDNRIIKGIKMSYKDAEDALEELTTKESLKATTYDINSVAAENAYYKLQKIHLEEMGLHKLEEDAEYIVNYSTGEVFNITEKTTATGEILYVYGK